MGNEVSSNISGDVTMSIRKDNIKSFAAVTLLALILCIGALTTISSRQSTLMESEADLQQLQNRISATIFLQLEGKSSLKDSEPKAEINSPLIDPKTIEKTYLKLNEDVASTKAEISDGLPLFDQAGSGIIHMPFRYISTEALLGMLLISCGVLGSIMSTLRDEGSAVSKPIVLGASVGFVALLGVKSGSTLFILTNAGVEVPYNAYSTALAGVVAGMFSEKLYLALSSLTDKAFGSNK